MSDYVELDGSRVVAILENDCVPLLQWRGDPMEPGRIVGLAPGAGWKPVWLASVLEVHAQELSVVFRARIGDAAASTWYGPGEAMQWGGDCGAGDYRPSNYEVYGILCEHEQGPPVRVSAEYVRVPRLRCFVPAPYRRDGCWYMEKTIAKW